MSHLEKAVETLRSKLGNGVLSVEEFRDQITVVLDRGVIVQACEIMRDDAALKFNLLAALTAVDYWPDEPRFSVIYQLYSIPNRVFLGLRVPVDSESLEVDTIEGIYPNANWHEREVFDMFGIAFKGHSDLRRILMPHDWEGHPLRKDYPLGYEEVQFSFNFDEIDGRKPYAKE
ncbi:MAG: NADH-quinone oxidoreductase subunit C [Anaerolineales bacterium]|nr:NADH-quinone oxidoreductase subunit C [Anaerolineales bacterium]